MSDFPDSMTPPATNHRSLPVREDCWTEEASSTLVDAWGRRYLELNRGNLRQKDWQDVADAVNALHAHSKKTHRTDVQCKNRIDTIKKKYKVEKARVASSNGAVSSSWPFFERLDSLIGPNFIAKISTSSPSLSPPVALPLLPYRKTQSPVAAPFTSAVLPQKRSVSAVMDDGYFRRNYSAMAAAAAAAEADDDDDEEEDDEEEEEEMMEDEGRGSEVEEGERDRGKDGMRRLAKAIESFGEMYERVEEKKLRQLVDLEKQRMQFAKEVEVQRMQMFMDTQVQLERIKHGKTSGSNNIYS
ncbi:putative transcription factor Trihelix family [Lupinus albus]|uniref:Putative transcription factor Trihelix family n=1 Tax=Lupinus albus TaxID=3870 RepID=A0A6A4NQW2_LUPAL|nr:putative transcription factor Trihelix family [Lupinus albus]